MIFFTSDTHFNHTRILEICPERMTALKVNTVEEMNVELIRRINSVVEDTDDLIILGDFLMGYDKDTTLPDVMNKIRGRKYLIYGNHDPMINTKPELKRVDLYLSSGFREVLEGPVLLSDIILDAPEYLLSHYPYRGMEVKDKYSEFRPLNAGLSLLHGHTHKHNRKSSNNSVHVGVDAWDYYPVSMEEIDAIIANSSSCKLEYLV